MSRSKDTATHRCGEANHVFALPMTGLESARQATLRLEDPVRQSDICPFRNEGALSDLSCTGEREAGNVRVTCASMTRLKLTDPALAVNAGVAKRL